MWGFKNFSAWIQEATAEFGGRITLAERTRPNPVKSFEIVHLPDKIVEYKETFFDFTPQSLLLKHQ